MFFRAGQSATLVAATGAKLESAGRGESSAALPTRNQVPRTEQMIFYVDTLYIAKSFHAYAPSPPSFFGLEMGIAPPHLALHIYPGVARLSATSNIKNPSLGACLTRPRSL